MREQCIERQLVRQVHKLGGIAMKFVSPGTAGVPDRLLLFPGGKAVFVETKAPGRKPRPLQKYRHEQLRNLGFKVYVIDEMKQIREVLNDLRST